MKHQSKYLAALAAIALLLATSAPVLAADLKEQAAAALTAQDFKRAAELYRQVILESPDDGMAHYRLGRY